MTAGRVIGGARSAWRPDLPFVAPDGAVALATGAITSREIKNNTVRGKDIRNRPQLTVEIIRRLSNWIVQSDRERTFAHR